jgi:hypothetical protein
MGVKTIVAGILISFFIIVVIIGIGVYFMSHCYDVGKELKKQVTAKEEEYKKWVESPSPPKTEQKPIKQEDTKVKVNEGGYKSQGKCVVSADGLESYCY